VLLRQTYAHRQRLLALAGALLLGALGDGLVLSARVLGGGAETMVVTVATTISIVASLLTTAVLLGVLMDSIVIARTLARGPRAFRDTVRRSHGDGP
jgi:hypothetical protein